MEGQVALLKTNQELALANEVAWPALALFEIESVMYGRRSCGLGLVPLAPAARNRD
jgi:hypothetical protein